MSDTQKWRMLGVGDVRKPGCQYRLKVDGPDDWFDEGSEWIGTSIYKEDLEYAEYRVPVTNEYAANTSNLPRRHKLNPSITVIVDDVTPHSVEAAAQTIAGDAAARALSGREMSARQVWERMALVCGMRGSCGCCGGPCHMGTCPRLRGT